jgi:hypothetical protein
MARRRTPTRTSMPKVRFTRDFDHRQDGETSLAYRAGDVVPVHEAYRPGESSIALEVAEKAVGAGAAEPAED